ncbi:putative signal-transduction protein containing cAMP-binding protein [Winogradskyella psychrotolerans RS-3]|uniref:Putative signal-transduction protein containing cAMP-binding protein n=1 Tax=Winogradskyella psychrotolerans RS-3 TaxID=641526 RepID=S7XFJ7_9FLAO|nr:CBS domain-containing protein [Winogradskyella psychrotolerans]EPR74753.1 putative signal-transduction protein containing cAMP-binding protein [Winogradskyella psychrotolerans RS-3]
MRNTKPISTIMSTNIITLKKDDELETAELLFKRHKIRHIPVVKNEAIIGMLSYTDLLRISFADAVDETETEIETLVYNMFTIEQVMAKNVITVSSDASIKDVALILAQKEFHALPVVDDDRLVGIVTTTDLINYLLKEL